MSGRTLKVVEGLVVLALLAWVLYVWTEPKDNITWEGFDKIELCMSESEIKEVLGAVPGQYTTGKIRWIYPGKNGLEKIEGDRSNLEHINTHERIEIADLQKDGKQVWLGNKCGIWVKFGADGRAMSKGAGSVTQLEGNLCNSVWYRFRN